jgi:hypothetical protein
MKNLRILKTPGAATPGDKKLLRLHLPKTFKRRAPYVYYNFCY